MRASWVKGKLHYSGSKEPLEFQDAMMERVTILKLEAQTITGKQHK